MFSREETQKLKSEFWIAFAKKYPRKWILYDTKIKDFSFKFFVDNKKAAVLIDIESKNEHIRTIYFEKLLSLRSILEENYVSDAIYDQNITLENGKVISRVSIQKIGYGMTNKNNWELIFDFFYEKMNLLEHFFDEYRDYISDLETNT
jgi:hypothetical protein